MKIKEQVYCINGLNYMIRSAVETDAKDLSSLRVQIDGETEYLDREQGEAFIDEEGFKQLIAADTENARKLFLVASVDGNLVGFCRCEGSVLKRFSHKVEFGVCVLRDYWGYQIGKKLLESSISWADMNGIKKIGLNVLETNKKVIKIYEEFGFKVEGVLRRDKILSDGKYYNTIVMGRIIE
ncbi:GNAT family N-acetyltransferase [Tissierella sp. MSJ-40]|uniref:GNAT family N-acetyltransferase n=1 Tax=Tissierella simiarum TaxID=2841534 RepID=A0ABS6EA66_9FIRM|nr:GNAT family N-acetyltransferase [Tissierella simiarum]MBU5439822.1 GNAT family N-acetyltransferase [Tissierella simiarum]